MYHKPSSRKKTSDEFMKILWVFFILVVSLAVIVLVVVYVPRLFDQGQPASPVAPTVTSNEFLEVTSPGPNLKIKSPVEVQGRSNFFEANTRVRIKDDVGTVLADTFTTAEGYMDALYPFVVLIEYDQPRVKTGVIEVFEESAKDGTEIHKVTIPVEFLDFKKGSPLKTTESWETTDLMGVYSFDYPAGWHVSNTWDTPTGNEVMIYLSPEPINLAPRGGMDAIMISDKSGLANATEVFEQDMADFKTGLTQVEEEMITANFGTAYHIQGMADVYEQEMSVEAYFFLLEGTVPEQTEMHIIKVTEDISLISGESQAETLRTLVESFERSD